MEDIKAQIQKRLESLKADKDRAQAKVEFYSAKIEALEEVLQNSTEAVTAAESLFKASKVKTIDKSSTTGNGHPMSMVDAAELVLKESGKAMHVKDIWNAIAERKLSVSEGKNPIVNLNSALLRYIKKGKRFSREGEGNPIYTLKN